MRWWLWLPKAGGTVKLGPVLQLVRAAAGEQIMLRRDEQRDNPGV